MLQSAKRMKSNQIALVLAIVYMKHCYHCQHINIVTKTATNTMTTAAGGQFKLKQMYFWSLDPCEDFGFQAYIAPLDTLLRRYGYTIFI